MDGDIQFAKPVRIGVATVRLNSGRQQTSIRTDKSGTQSRAEEVVYDARILIEPDATFSFGDKIDLFGLTYKVEVIFPRYEMTGILHHYQVDLNRWQD